MKIKEIQMDLIKQNPFQTRDTIQEEPLKILVKSIRERGLINPITLLKRDGEYIIVNGHRRFEAYRKLRRVGDQYLKIPAIVKTGNVNNELKIDLVHENLVREDLTPVEKGMAIKLLISEIETTENDVKRMCTLINMLKNYNRRGYIPEIRKSQTVGFKENDIFKLQEILKSIGISENNAITYLTILGLPSHMRHKMIFRRKGVDKSGKLSIKQAEQLVRVHDREFQEYLFKKCLEGKTTKSLQAAIDLHIKKIERGEWNGIKQTKAIHKFKDDLDKLNEITEKARLFSANISSFRVDTLMKLDETMEKEEFEQEMKAFVRELDCLTNKINDKLVDKGMKPLDRPIEDFEMRARLSPGKVHFRTNIPMHIVKKLNLSSEYPEFLKVRIIGRRK